MLRSSYIGGKGAPALVVMQEISRSLLRRQVYPSDRVLSVDYDLPETSEFSASMLRELRIMRRREREREKERSGVVEEISKAPFYKEQGTMDGSGELTKLELVQEAEALRRVISAYLK
ncbi:hypothetical protein R1sor_015572 [Riccia sorocarpa]|uniref:Uncharacterized protein n=1 Tax=Riccia sorocarpa TaxID=122646 RepID=A0ABD3HCZ4_9MARC